jgi:hypothetical protein
MSNLHRLSESNDHGRPSTSRPRERRRWCAHGGGSPAPMRLSPTRPNPEISLSRSTTETKVRRRRSFILGLMAPGTLPTTMRGPPRSSWLRWEIDHPEPTNRARREHHMLQRSSIMHSDHHTRSERPRSRVESMAAARAPKPPGVWRVTHRPGYGLDLKGSGRAPFICAWQGNPRPTTLRGFRGHCCRQQVRAEQENDRRSGPTCKRHTRKRKGKNVEWAGVQEFGPRLRLWTTDGLRGGVGGPRQRGFGPGAGFLHFFLFKFKLLFVFNYFKSKWVTNSNLFWISKSSLYGTTSIIPEWCNFYFIYLDRMLHIHFF